MKGKNTTHSSMGGMKGEKPRMDGKKMMIWSLSLVMEGAVVVLFYKACHGVSVFFFLLKRSCCNLSIFFSHKSCAFYLRVLGSLICNHILSPFLLVGEISNQLRPCHMITGGKKFGCPSLEELESYSQEYKKRLDETGALGNIPDDLALEVSSPGAERLLKVPDDLFRFKAIPMRVSYIEEVDSRGTENDGVYMLDRVESEYECCIWKLANVRENRDPLSKGRPLTRKQKEWRLKLPYANHKKVFLYLEC